MISGLIDFAHFGVLTEPGPEPQDIRRMIELAHAAGFAVMAHANGDRAVTAALQARVDSIEHGAYLSESVLLRMAQQRTLWVPTLSTIGNLIGSGRYPDAVLKRCSPSSRTPSALSPRTAAASASAAMPGRGM